MNQISADNEEEKTASVSALNPNAPSFRCFTRPSLRKGETAASGLSLPPNVIRYAGSVVQGARNL